MYLPLVREMVRRELRGRYAGSALGFFWSVIHPLLQLVIYTLVFGVLLKQRLGNDPSITSFAIYLFCGLLPWNAFAESLNRGGTSLLENASLIKNLRFPAKIIQISISINALLHQCMGLGLLLLIAGFVHRGFHLSSLLLLPLMAIQYVFMLGIALLIAPLVVSFRDILQILPVINMVWMFTTPIFYSEAVVPASLHFMIDLNPMRYFVQMSRSLLLDGRVPGLLDWAIIMQMSLFTLLLGHLYYTARHPRFADEL